MSSSRFLRTEGTWKILDTI